jgi:hypothetical protein
MSTMLDPSQWFRVDSGRRRELPHLSTDDLTQVVDRLPAEFGPYVLVAHELVPGDQGYVSRSSVVRSDGLGDFVDRGVWQYFIVSTVLSSELLSRLPDVNVPSLAVNGTISLQLWRRTPRGVEAPSIGLVPKVATKEGEVREHREYAVIFEKAVREFRRRR